jgi:hypothetical protein
MKSFFCRWWVMLSVWIIPFESYAQLSPPTSMNFPIVTATTFKASWNPVTSADVYLFQYATNPNFSPYSSFGTTSTEYTVAGLAASTTYYCRIASQPYSGAPSAWSQTWTVTTSNPPPAAPTGVTSITHTTNSFTAKWNPTNYATNYIVEVAGSVSFSPIIYANFTTGTSLLIPGLNVGTQYFFRVRANNSSGTSSNTVSMTYTLTNAPSILNTTDISENRFRANWGSVPGASGYSIDVSTTSDFASFVNSYQNRSVTGSSEMVSNLGSGVYYYRIRAKNAINMESENSTTAIVSELNQNYIRTIDVLTAGMTTAEQVDNAGLLQRATRYNFLDGLGRPIQEVLANGSPTGSDIIQPIAYDAYGRETMKYLPYVSGSEGWYKSNFLTADNANYQTTSSPQYKFYQTTPNVAVDPKPYAQSILEPSPLNRVLKQGAPGSVWQPNASPYSAPTDNTIALAYETNTEGEVLIWTYTPPVVAGLSGSVSTDRAYGPNQLHKTRTKDEHHNEVIEYTDKEGRVVLKKAQAPDNEWAETYYVYDEHGKLILVLPPKAVKTLSSNSNY